MPVPPSAAVDGHPREVDELAVGCAADAAAIAMTRFVRHTMGANMTGGSRHQPEARRFRELGPGTGVKVRMLLILAMNTDQPILLPAIDYSLMDAVVKLHLEQVRYCYTHELQRNPSLGGWVVMKFILDRDGAISHVRAAESTLGNEAVEACLVHQFESWVWPQGRSVYLVKYPIRFRRKVAHTASAAR